MRHAIGADTIGPETNNMDGPMKYLTLSDLRQKLGNRSRSAIYLDMEAGRLPRPVKLGGRLYWPEQEIDTHLEGLRA